jgi:hypothetical protein
MVVESSTKLVIAWVSRLFKRQRNEKGGDPMMFLILFMVLAIQCEPSCYAKILDFQQENGEGDSRIVLIARKDVAAGSELT